MILESETRATGAGSERVQGLGVTTLTALHLFEISICFPRRRVWNGNKETKERRCWCELGYMAKQVRAKDG